MRHTTKHLNENQPIQGTITILRLLKAFGAPGVWLYIARLFAVQAMHVTSLPGSAGPFFVGANRFS